MVDFNPVRVHQQDAMEHLKLALDGYRSHWNRVYIGVTSHPQARWRQHELDGWYKMRVLYEAFTPAIARALERNLIDYAWRCHFQVDVENFNPGGEGIREDSPTHYLYVLVGDRKLALG